MYQSEVYLVEGGDPGVVVLDGVADLGAGILGVLQAPGGRGVEAAAGRTLVLGGGVRRVRGGGRVVGLNSAQAHSVSMVCR